MRLAVAQGDDAVAGRNAKQWRAKGTLITAHAGDQRSKSLKFRPRVRMVLARKKNVVSPLPIGEGAAQRVPYLGHVRAACHMADRMHGLCLGVFVWGDGT